MKNIYKNIYWFGSYSRIFCKSKNTLIIRWFLTDCQVRKAERPKPNTFLVRGLQLTNVVERMFCSETAEDR